MTLSRRYFIKASTLATGGLSLALCEGCFSSRTQSIGDENLSPKIFSPSIWIEIHNDGKILFILDKIEMGQSIYTSLSAIIAEELDIKPKDLTIHFAPAHRKFGNPSLLGMQMTGGSTSIASSIDPLRKAGATARLLIIRAAAQNWKVAEESCKTDHGFVIHQESGRKQSYASLATAASQFPVPDDVPLKPKSQWTLIGKALRRLDGPLKVTGQAVFGIDVEVPQALVAVLIRPPHPGATLVQFNATEAEKIPGIKKIFAIDAGIVVVAQKYYTARKASQLVVAQWKNGHLSAFSTQQFTDDLRQRSARMLAKAFDDISPKTIDKNQLTLEATYELPFLAHATLEPQNCTALVTQNEVKIWAPTQGPGLLQHLAAKLTQMPLEKVHVIPTFLGGGFGRRLSQDYGIEAVMIAMHFKEPVMLMWSREDDTRHDFYRPAMVHRLKAIVSTDISKSIHCWAHGSSGPSILEQSLPTWVPVILPSWVPEILKDELRALTEKIYSDWKLIPDPTSIEGAQQIPYSTSRHSHQNETFNPGIPVGFWRSVGHSHTCFAVESFIDEIASILKQDPIQLRLSLLQDQPRFQEVLMRLKKFSRWDESPQKSLGLALHKSFGSIVGEVAEVEVSGAEIRVKNVWVVIDCGVAVNPLHVEAQMMGSVIFGITSTLFSEITFKDGAAEQSSFDNYPLLRFDQTPDIHVEIIKSEDPPAGVGEPGVPPVAPAIANAVYRATGKRLRSLPLRIT